VSDIFLSNEVLIYLLSESVVYVLLMIAALLNIQLMRQWDFGAFNPRQFALEKRAYLVMTIITFAFAIKIILLPYFAYGIDRLSNLVPGAMCAAGVIGANDFGYPLLGIKTAILILTGIWITVNTLDLKATDYPFFKVKSLLFMVIFALVSLEFFLDFTYFSNIETSNPVSCCSVTFGAQGADNPLPFGLDTAKLLLLFYLIYLLSAITALSRYAAIGLAANAIFLAVSYYAVVYFFGTYIYELPTHKCPFCMLQKEYWYVGYLLWGTLLAGTFFGINAFVVTYLLHKNPAVHYRFSLFFNTLFVLLVSSYVFIYYLSNGVWL